LQRYDFIYKRKWVVALILFLGYVYVGLALLPPVFGVSGYTFNVKYQTCYLTAYDLYSYIHGCLLLTLIMGPVFALIPVCYWKIFKKVISCLHDRTASCLLSGLVIDVLDLLSQRDFLLTLVCPTE